eukprot:9155875-Pyramimonas_sp.AAC.1
MEVRQRGHLRETARNKSIDAVSPTVQWQSGLVRAYCPCRAVTGAKTSRHRRGKSRFDSARRIIKSTRARL